MTNNDDENNEQDVCESCEHDECSWHQESSMFLCKLCAPWVQISLRRTDHIPYGVLKVTQRSPDVFQEIRNLITDNASTKRHLGNWNLSGSTAVPHNEEGWMEFLQWILGTTNELVRVKTAIELRKSTIGTSESVSGIRHQMIKKSEIGDDMVVEDGWGTWVNGVLFGSGAHDMHCHDATILPQLLFDRFHGLDHRPVDEMAYAYQKGPWLNQIRETTSARVPTTPALRELLTRVYAGELGKVAADRFLAATVIWAVHVEREFHTCPRESWTASFGWVHQIARENDGRVRFEEDGIYIDATSKNLYRITPHDRSDGFEVRQYARSGKDRTPPICIHTTRAPHELELAMGDVVASLVLALLDDIESSEHIHTLARHISGQITPSGHHPDRGAVRGHLRAMWRRALRDAGRAGFEGNRRWLDGYFEEE